MENKQNIKLDVFSDGTSESFMHLFMCIYTPIYIIQIYNYSCNIYIYIYMNIFPYRFNLIQISTYSWIRYTTYSNFKMIFQQSSDYVKVVTWIRIFETLSTVLKICSHLYNEILSHLYTWIIYCIIIIYLFIYLYYMNNLFYYIFNCCCEP